MASNRRPPRTVRLPVRLRPEEDALLRARARECGMTVARYMRETALGRVPRARPGRLEMEAIRELGRIGAALGELEQVAHDAGRTEQAAELRAVREEVLAAARGLA